MYQPDFNPQEQPAFFPQQAYGAPQDQQALFPQQASGAPQDGFWQQQQAYGAPMNYGSVDGASPQEPMSEEERKQAKKDTKEAEKDKDKYERLLRVRKKRDAAIARDNKCFVYGFSAMLLLLGLLLVLTMFGKAWGYKRFIGSGIGVLTLRTSLLYIDMDLKCDKSFFLEKWLCQNMFVAEDVNGIHALDDSQAAMCAVPGIGRSACDVMAHAYYSNFVIVLFFSLAALTQLLAAFFLWNYYCTLHHPKYRFWATGLTVSGPSLAVFGLCLWSVTFPDLGRIPYSVNIAAEALIGGAGFLGFSELHGLAFGYTYFVAIFIIFLMLAQCLVWFCFFNRQDDEEDIEIMEEQEKDFIANLEAHGYNAPETSK